MGICVIDILIVSYQHANKEKNMLHLRARHNILHLYIYTFHVSATVDGLFLHYTHSAVLGCAQKGI